jgi:hypothetical protein
MPKELIRLKRTTLFLVFIFALALSANADTIRGVVRNGTTNKPSAGDEVVLKRVGNGMEDVGTTKTNAKGEFTFNAPATQGRPYLLWVKHQEVTYTRVAQAGGGPVAVQVFDSSATVKDISLPEHMLVMQTTAAGDQLKVDELFTVDNRSTPPMTKNGQHTLDVFLPEGAKVEETSAQPAGNMALKTPVVPDKSAPNAFFFGFPIRPGQTQFRVSYSLPYSGKIQLNPKTSLPAGNFLVVAPDSMHFAASDGSVYTPTKDPQIKDVTLYLVKSPQPSQQLGFTVAGTGIIPQQSNDQPPANAGSAPRGEGPGGGMAPPNDRPDPLQNGQWLFLGVLVIFLAAGAVYVYTANINEPQAKAASRRKSKGRSGVLLDAMKEEVFQLEADRIQGKINDKDYESAKAALDKTLQRAMQRQTVSK